MDGLPVGSIFSFVWNAMISMSFQLVGFLLTYLLHTTHAAKNGSRAGLGLTLVQYGFYMKGGSDPKPDDGGDADASELGRKEVVENRKRRLYRWICSKIDDVELADTTGDGQFAH